MERDFGDDAVEELPKPTTYKVPDSKLHVSVQDLIKMIFNLDMMAQQMMEVGYDGENYCFAHCDSKKDASRTSLENQYPKGIQLPCTNFGRAPETKASTCDIGSIEFNVL